MTDGEARRLIQNVRLQFRLSTLMKLILLAAVAAGLVLLPLKFDPQRRFDIIGIVATAAIVIWLGLTLLSVRQVRSAGRATLYIASGRLDLAEAQLVEAIRAFTLSRAGTLMACHNLAVVEHGRSRFNVAAEICRGVLSLGVRLPTDLARTCRILLADCYLILGDELAATRALGTLSTRDPVLGLTEQILLLPIELQCQLARKEYSGAASNLAWKVRRAELLDSVKASRVHRLLADACRATGQEQQAVFLERRARVYEGYEATTETGLPDSDSADTSADNN